VPCAVGRRGREQQLRGAGAGLLARAACCVPVSRVYQALLDQFAAIESCLRDFVAFRKSGTADDAQVGVQGGAAAALTVCLSALQLLLLLDRVADGLAFVEKWPTFKETAVYSGRLKQLSQW
jgi:hypothetical protein